MKVTMQLEFDSLAEVTKVLNAMNGSITTTITAPNTASVLTKTAKDRLNVCPGEPTISKMGAAMKKAMLAGVGSNAFTDNYEGASTKYLLLMWKRGEIKFDGRDYYK